jgi:hypothetical protein
MLAHSILHGDSNIGKTKITAKFRRTHPIEFDDKSGVEQCPVVAMQMPPTPDQRAADPIPATDRSAWRVGLLRPNGMRIIPSGRNELDVPVCCFLCHGCLCRYRVGE